jgi:hypothetical protein
MTLNRETAERSTMLQGLVGSTVHGLNVNDGIEDRDEMGVSVEPFEAAMSLRELHTTVGDVVVRFTFWCAPTRTRIDCCRPWRRAAAVSPDLAVIESSSMDAVVGRSLAVQRLRAWLAAFFASAAVLLAVVGIYAMTTISVAERCREIALKSSTFTRSSRVTLMFAGFRSRWTIPFSCAASSASTICRAMRCTIASSRSRPAS